MLNYDLLSIVLFYLFFIIFYLKNKQKFEVQGGIIFLYRTKLGLKLMDRMAKACPRLWNFLSYIIIAIGFAGMAYIGVWLTIGVIKQIFLGGVSPIAPVLPGVNIPGLPDLSFWHWIIAIFVVVVVHEFMHGVYARTIKIEVKNSGFGFFGPIPLAFVEPDEKEMQKAPKKGQLAILGAGAVTNIFFAFLFLLLFQVAITPWYDNTFDKAGILVEQVQEESPTKDLEIPFVIKALNNKETLTGKSFLDITTELEIGQEVIVATDKGDFTLEVQANPENASKPYLGLQALSQHYELKENTNPWYGKFVSWMWLLIFWLFVVNLGIGLFNLLPLGPVDGGKMFYLLALAIFKKEKTAKKVWSVVSLLFILMILIGLLPYLGRLLMFLINLI